VSASQSQLFYAFGLVSFEIGEKPFVAEIERM
jgi:hypothetical protein